MDLFILVCFIAGLLSFLSPCVLPIIPSYLCFLTGASIKEIQEDNSFTAKRLVVTRAIYFVIGFSIVFIAMGASATFIRPILNFSFSLFGQIINLQKIAGLIIMVFGFHLIGLYNFPLLNRNLSLQISSKYRNNLISFTLGIAFAFGWTPCIGPVLATILTLAASKQTVYEGIILLSFYSAGLGIPFIISSFAVNRLIQFIQKFRNKIKYIELLMGVIMIITGIAFIFGLVQDGAFFLLENISILSAFGI
jgi:cytochrome c-type biogenesis protein